MMDTGLADRLRAMGLTVIEVDGWRTRGRTYATFTPRGSVDHHTAGGASGNAPSLGICINGRSDLPGPLCQAFQARNNDVYVVAAGVANHAGAGGWQGLKGNQIVHGLESENVGYNDREPWREDQIDVKARIHAAFLQAPGSTGDPGKCCMHKEWTAAKIDSHTILGDDLRSRVAHYLSTPNPPSPPEDDDKMMFLIRGEPTLEWWLTDLVTKRHVTSQEQASGIIWLNATRGGKIAHEPGDQPIVVGQAFVDGIPNAVPPAGGGSGATPTQIAAALRAELNKTRLSG